MSKIIQKKLQFTIDQHENKLDYFTPVQIDSKLQDNSTIINALSNAKETILIASTKGLQDSILETIIAVSKNVRVYIILKSFDNTDKTIEKTLINFNKKNPAIIREVPELDNNFIIIDANAILCVNSLANPFNIQISLKKLQSKDLYYWFNYYFWNKATKEKYIDKIDMPKESPYPPFNSEKDTITLQNTEPETVNILFTPQDSSYKKFDAKFENKEWFLSGDIRQAIFVQNTTLQIGNFRITCEKEQLEIIGQSIGKLFKLANNTLDNIQNEIIPLNETDWLKCIAIKNDKTVSLGPKTAKSVKTITKTGYLKDQLLSKYFEPYCRKVQYQWDVNPPQKPNDASKSSLYKTYEQIKTTLHENLTILENELNAIISKKTPVVNLFSGRVFTAKNKLKEIKNWKSLDVSVLDFNELKDRFTKNGQFENFFNEIIKSSKDFNIDVDKKEQEESWNSRKKDLENKINGLKIQKNNIENELALKDTVTKELTERIIKSQNDKKSDNKEQQTTQKELKQKQEEVKKLQKTLAQLKSDIKGSESDLKNKYSIFKYQSNGNELDVLKKRKKIHQAQAYKTFQLPKYRLPEVGVLYENLTHYFLEIEDYEELTKANEIAKERYIDKPCLVVASQN